jgi:glycerol kinase
LSRTTVLAIDQGTTETKVVLFNDAGQILARASREVTQYFPRPGWVEHDPAEILSGALDAAAEVIAQSGTVPAAIGITNQRETIVVWDKHTGEPLHRAIVWQCRRTAEICDRLRADGAEALVRARTGLLLDPYFSATKLAWLLHNVSGLAARVRAGEVLAGTMDTWLAWNLTGRHVTDCSNAARTSLFNLATRAWDRELTRLFNVPEAVLPEIVDTSGVVGKTRAGGRLPAGIPVAALVGDQQAALFGQACFRRGMAKNTYGTGSFLLINTGEEIVHSDQGLLTTVGWRRNAQTVYCLEGSVFIAGAAVQWLRDELGIIDSAAEIETLAASVPDSGGVAFVPAFVGLGTPYWDPTARGAILGITRGSGRAHLARACLEALAHQSQDVLDCMEQEGVQPLVLRADGGAAANDLLLQIQADLSGLEVHRPAVIETTAWGAAMLAGLAVGLWADESELEQVWQINGLFRPQWNAATRTAARAFWARAVERCRGWA